MLYQHLLLPSVTSIHEHSRTQCISCHKFLYLSKKRKKNEIVGKLIRVDKITRIFVHKRILLDSKHNYICSSCDQKM